MLTNSAIQREGAGTEPHTVESLPREELRPLIGRLQRELRGLKLERTALVHRIGMIKKTVTGLADLFGSDVINRELQDLLSLQSADCVRPRPGLTRLCRQVLRQASKPLTMHQIFGQLQEKSAAGLARHGHPAHSLKVILQGLVARGEAEELLTEAGLQAWRLTSNRGHVGTENPDPPQQTRGQIASR
jgi:hypothetical protein